MIQSVRELLNRDPFSPFRIVTASGEKYEVNNPELLAVGKDQIFLFDRTDHFVFIRNNQITAVESIRTAA